MFSSKRLRVEISRYEYKENLDIDFNSKSTYVFDDYKIVCKINKVPATCGYTATLDIYGVSQKSLNQITNIYWINGKVIPMGVRILADDGNGYVTVFEGGIMEAVPNYKNVPDVSIHIESSMMVYPNLKKPSSISLESGTLISDFCKALCSEYGISCETAPEVMFVWNGDTKVFNQRSFGMRARELCRLVGLDYSFRANKAIFFKRWVGKRRVWTFTPQNYVGYPSFENFGVSVKTENITSDFNCADAMKIVGSAIPQANGLWIINSLEYILESRKENGRWDLIIHGTRTEEKSE